MYIGNAMTGPLSTHTRFWQPNSKIIRTDFLSLNSVLIKRHIPFFNLLNTSSKSDFLEILIKTKAMRNVLTFIYEN